MRSESLFGSTELFQLSNCLPDSPGQQLSKKHTLCIWETSMISLLSWKALIHAMDADKLMLFMLSELEEIITAQLTNSN